MNSEDLVGFVLEIGGDSELNKAQLNKNNNLAEY